MTATTDRPTAVVAAPARPPASATARRILFLEFYRELGGAELYLVELLRRLDANRYAASVATPGDGALAAALRRDGVRVSPVGGFAHVVAYSRSAAEVAGNVRRLLATTAGLRRLARQERAALIHAFITPAFKYAGLVGRSLGRPVVGTLHDTLSPDLGWTVPKRRLLMANVNLTFDRVVCVAEAARRAAIEAGGEPARLVTIHNGVDAARYRAAPGDRDRVRAEFGLPADAVAVGLVGRFTAGKGHLALLEAVRPLLASRPELRVVFVGGAVFEEERAQLAAVAEAARAEIEAGRVVFAGWRNDMAAVLAALDVVAVPSTLPDTFPGVAHQAMSAGRPVVGSAIGGIPEIVADGETGLLAPPGDADGLRSALVRLLDTPDLRRRLGRTGAEVVEARFSIERSARRLEALYDELLAGRPARRA